MSIQATNTFHTKPGYAGELIATLRQVLPDTLKHGGCEEIRLWHDQDDANRVVSATRWGSPPRFSPSLPLPSTPAAQTQQS